MTHGFARSPSRRSAEQIFEVQFEVHIGSKCCRAFEFHEHVHVAGRVQIVAHHRAKQGDPLHTKTRDDLLPAVREQPEIFD